MQKTKEAAVTRKIIAKIGKEICDCRTDQGKSILGLKEEAGVSDVTLSGLEKGQMKNVSVETLAKISTALGKKLSISLTD